MPATIAISALTLIFFAGAYTVFRCRKSVKTYSRFLANLYTFIIVMLVVSGCFLFYAMHLSQGIDVIEVTQNYLSGMLR